MSLRTFELPDLDDQPVLNHVQKAVLAHVQRSEYQQKVLLRRWYADKSLARQRMAERRDAPHPYKRRAAAAGGAGHPAKPPKRHRAVERPTHH